MAPALPRSPFARTPCPSSTIVWKCVGRSPSAGDEQRRQQSSFPSKLLRGGGCACLFAGRSRESSDQACESPQPLLRYASSGAHWSRMGRSRLHGSFRSNHITDPHSVTCTTRFSSSKLRVGVGTPGVPLPDPEESAHLRRPGSLPDGSLSCLV